MSAATRSMSERELRDEIRWHQFRTWATYRGAPEPPADVENPCGDCARPKADHPIPHLPTIGFDAQEVLARLVLSICERPQSGGSDPEVES